MTDDPLAGYWAALARLRAGNPEVLPKRTKITNDAVSLEAGRKKGSIKKSRPQFERLIAAISEAALVQARPKKTQIESSEKARQTVRDLRKELDDALGREHSLLMELYEVRVKLNKITGENVLPIRRRSSK